MAALEGAMTDGQKLDFVYDFCKQHVSLLSDLKEDFYGKGGFKETLHDIKKEHDSCTEDRAAFKTGNAKAINIGGFWLRLVSDNAKTIIRCATIIMIFAMIYDKETANRLLDLIPK